MKLPARLRILLINCYQGAPPGKMTAYRDCLQSAAARIKIALDVRPAAADGSYDARHDAVVVSGSELMVGDGQFSDRLVSFIRSNRKPLLGICYGHQLLVNAFDGRVIKTIRQHRGWEQIHLRNECSEQSEGSEWNIFAGFPPQFAMMESHREVALNDESFLVLAVSDSGAIEAVKHRRFPFWGVQFHPEKSLSRGVKLLENFLRV